MSTVHTTLRRCRATPTMWPIPVSATSGSPSIPALRRLPGAPGVLGHRIPCILPSDGIFDGSTIPSIPLRACCILALCRLRNWQEASLPRRQPGVANRSSLPTQVLTGLAQLSASHLAPRPSIHNLVPSDWHASAVLMQAHLLRRQGASLTTTLTLLHALDTSQGVKHAALVTAPTPLLSHTPQTPYPISHSLPRSRDRDEYFKGLSARSSRRSSRSSPTLCLVVIRNNSESEVKTNSEAAIYILAASRRTRCRRLGLRPVLATNLSWI